MDRNLLRYCRDSVFERSLSARRAWIEIFWYSSRIIMLVVALRKESVDRNHNSVRRCLMSVVSLSARRAWIEIQKLLKKY